MTDTFKKHLIDLAIEIKEDVAEELGPADNPTCALCGDKKFKKKRIASDCAYEAYAVDCTKNGCEGAMSFVHLYVEVGDSVPIVNRVFRALRCTGTDCNGSDLILQDIVEQHDPIDRKEYVLLVKGIVTTSIHEHHTSYDPEETMLLCAQCHMKVHHDDDFRPDLQPDMSRTEWEEEANV